MGTVLRCLSSGQVLGYLFHRPEKPPTEDEVICWIALSQGVAVTMQRSGSIEPDAGRKMQETILLQLALGQLTDSSIVQARLEQSGWKALANYRLGCMFTEEVSLFRFCAQSSFPYSCGTFSPAVSVAATAIA